MACFLLVTFLPLRPDLSVPFFFAFISVATLLLAAGEYLRAEDFLVADFLVALFFALVVFFALAFFALVDLVARVDFLAGAAFLVRTDFLTFTDFLVLTDFLAEADFFFAAFLAIFLVAIRNPPRCSDDRRGEASCLSVVDMPKKVMTFRLLNYATQTWEANKRISNEPASHA